MEFRCPNLAWWYPKLPFSCHITLELPHSFCIPDNNLRFQHTPVVWGNHRAIQSGLSELLHVTQRLFDIWLFPSRYAQFLGLNPAAGTPLQGQALRNTTTLADGVGIWVYISRWLILGCAAAQPWSCREIKSECHEEPRCKAAECKHFLKEVRSFT